MEVSKCDRVTSSNSHNETSPATAQWTEQLLILQIIWSCSMLNFSMIKIENH